MSTVRSEKSLVVKLGIREGFKIVIINPPEGYEKDFKSPKGVVAVKELLGPLDFIHFFTEKRDELEGRFPVLKRALSKNGALWVSWPKGSSRVETDLDENVVREVGLKNGLVDVKVIALDETWSGLKFVYRVKDRR